MSKKLSKTVNKRPTIKELDKLWADCIKARAGHKSEYKPADGYLNAHHIIGKPNYRLRWELSNGVCITGGQHKFIAHHTGRSGAFRKWALEKRQVTEEYLEKLGQQLGGTDLFGVKLFLQLKLKEFGCLGE